MSVSKHSKGGYNTEVLSSTASFSSTTFRCKLKMITLVVPIATTTWHS